MDEEENLKTSLDEYRQQLSAVNLALEAPQSNCDLKDLQQSLLEVIDLTEESLLSVKKKKLLLEIEAIEQKSNTSEEEFARFQAEISNATPTSGSIEDEEAEIEEEPEETGELEKCLSLLEGSRCRAPYSQAWGQLAYHNALVIGVEAEGAESIDDVDVSVLFCNPTCTSMRPCSFFLEGHCKFSGDQCNFSHGYVVKLPSLQEFKEPDYTLLQRDAVCLAKYHDDVWYQAQVLELLDDNNLKVKYSQYNEEAVLDVENLLPLENQPVYDGSDFSESVDFETAIEREDNDTEERPRLPWSSSTDVTMGDWEKHTKGFGSKIMEQMGYIKGQGLGLRADGRTEPIEATVLPQGKSLDMCMELREKRENRNEDLAEKHLKHKKKVLAEKIASGYKETPRQKKRTVFDFLNSKLDLKKSKKDLEEFSQNSARKRDVKMSSVEGLNVQSLQVNEEIKRAQREMKRLHEALTRNKDKDRVIKSQLEEKILAQEQVIRTLQTQERAISREQSSRNDHRKLTVF